MKMSEERFTIPLSKVVDEFEFEKLYVSKEYEDVLKK